MAMQRKTHKRPLEKVVHPGLVEKKLQKSWEERIDVLMLETGTNTAIKGKEARIKSFFQCLRSNILVVSKQGEIWSKLLAFADNLNSDPTAINASFVVVIRRPLFVRSFEECIVWLSN